MSGKERSHAGQPDSKTKRPQFSSRVLQSLIILGTALALGGILFIEWPVPSYDHDATSIGTVAEDDIVATHDFSFARPKNPDISAAREAARDQVRPIWDYDMSEQNVITSRIRPAFYLLRCRLYQAAQASRVPLTGSAVENTPDDGSVIDSVEEAPSGVVPNDSAPPTQQEGAEGGNAAENNVGDCGNGDASNILSSEERRNSVCSPAARSSFAEMLQIDEFSESLCFKFADEGFSSKVESSLRETILDLMGKKIVSSLAGLQESGPRGILLRKKMERQEDVEEVTTVFDSFAEIGTARERAKEAPLRNAEAVGTEETRTAIRELAAKLLRPNVSYNEAQTRSARESAAGTVISGTERVDFHRGKQILPDGGIIDAEVIEILEQMRATAPQRPRRAFIVLGTLGILGLFLVGFIMYSSSRRRRWNTKDLALTASVLVIQTLITKISILVSESLMEGGVTLTIDVFLALVPFAAGAMVIRVLTRATNALAFTVLYCILVGVMLDLQLIWVAYAIIACTFGAAAVRSATSRTDILRASVLVGVSMIAVTLCSALLGTISPGARLWAVALGALGSGVSTALLVNALLPLFELTFRYTTPIKLLELANLNQPLLREMVIKAPGTYHHSMMVSQLVEAGCDAIEADTLLGKIGAYYHDIGKMKSPQYFAENQSGDNPHDRLKPNMSALVIKAHVKDGAEMAKQHNLPPEIHAFIKEHHGTSLIEYFYRRAQDLFPDQVREEDYRYPGPKPQTRETAICMLADGIEAASRALPDKSEPHIKGLVNRMVNRAFTDGQLDNCDLTLKDLHEIARAFIGRLLAMHHQRPQYPGEKKRSDTRKTDAVKAVDGSGDNEHSPDANAKSEEGSTNGQKKKDDESDAKPDDSSSGGGDGDDGSGDDSDGSNEPSLRRLGI